MTLSISSKTESSTSDPTTDRLPSDRLSSPHPSIPAPANPPIETIAAVNPIATISPVPAQPTLTLSKILDKLSRPGQNNRRQPNVLGHCAISALAIGAIFMTTHGLKTNADARQREWMPEIKTEQFQTLPAESLSDRPLIKARLDQQLTETQARLHRHWSVTSYFYQQYFISISMTASLAVIAGGCGFFVSREGWSRSNNIIVNLFIVSSGGAIFFGQLPGIFKQDINISANWSLYQNYSSIRDEILTYGATGGTIAMATSVDGQPVVITPEQFIYSIDKKLASLNALPIQFDTSQIIKAPDVVNTIMGTSGGATGDLRTSAPAPRPIESMAKPKNLAP
jgi:hypothetical protein